jgi:hypothetical protein
MGSAQEQTYEAQCRGCRCRVTLREPVVFICRACHGEIVPLLTPEHLIWAYPAPDRGPLGDPLTALRDAALRVHHAWATARSAYGLEDAMILLREVLQALSAPGGVAGEERDA